MRFIKLSVAALVAVFALGAVIAASAFALPTILPTTANSFTGKKAGSGEAILEKANGEKVECSKATGNNGTVESNRHLGLFHISFEGCKAFGFIGCTGLGDNSGIILTLGSWHLVYDTLGSSLSSAGVAILFLVGEVHFSCSIELVIVPLGGMVLCLILNPTALTKVFEFHCTKGRNAGEAGETTYYNEAGTLTNIVALTSNKNERGAENSNEQALGFIEFSEAVLLDT
jgi:hypothetical protein